MGETKVTSITPDEDTFQSEVVVNEFDIRTWKINVNYSSGDTEVINVTYSMISLNDIRNLGNIGTYDITFSYEDCSFIYTISVVEPSDEEINRLINEAMTDDLIVNMATDNFFLPKTSGSVSITWSVDSNYVTIKGTKGVVTRPEFGNSDAKVIMHATFSLYNIALEKDYVVIVPAIGMDEVYNHLDQVFTSIQTPTSITDTLDLDFVCDDVTIIWHSSSDLVVIDNENKIVTVNPILVDSSVTLTVDLIYEGATYESYGSFIVKLLTSSTVKIAPKATNLKLSYTTLSWDAVSGISKYNIYVDGVLRRVVTQNKVNLSTLISVSGNYSIGVQSVASGVYNTDSEIETIPFTKTDEVTYNGSYYSKVNLTSTGDALKKVLRTLLQSTHSSVRTYENLKYDIPKTDASLTNSSKVLLIYSRVEVTGAWSNGGTIWNREHVWPQSKGWFSTSGAGSDLHHLRAEDPSVNTSRGNKPFGEVDGGSLVYLSSTNGGISSNCYGNNKLFEPQDASKGDVARIIFYLLTRYTESDSYNITVVASSIPMLLKWNREDPVDEWEMERNNKTENIQGNRNPFIDYPGLAEEIWG